MRRFAAATALAFSVALSVSDAGERFNLSDSDLPGLAVEDCHVAFTRNGALSVEKNGVWLFDTGLGYAAAGWKEWGTQVRRSAKQDGWTAADDGKTIVTHGTMFDINSAPRFRIVQKAVLIPNGVHLEYEVTPIGKQSADGMGIVIHCPVREMASAQMEFWPGLQTVQLPAGYGQTGLASTAARAASLSLSGKPLAAFVWQKDVAWSLFDERAWNLNSFQLAGWDDKAAEAIRQNETARFAFDLLLGEGVRKQASAGPLCCSVDPYGRVTAHLSGSLLIEGGLRSSPGGPWLLDGASSPVLLSDVPLEQLKGVMNAQSCDVRQEGDSIVLTCRWKEGVPDDTGLPARLAFVASAQPARARTDAAPGEPVETEGGTLLLSCGGNRTIELRADDDWMVSKRPGTGQELTVAALSPFPDAQGICTAVIRIRLRAETSAGGE